MRLRALLPALAAFALSCSDPTGPDPDETVTVAAGNGFSCAIVAEQVWCWGRNDQGQLGRGTTSVDEGPALVSGTYRFRLLAAAERTACGVTTDNGVVCWGHGRIFGSTTPVTAPTAITIDFESSITSLGVGYSHGCLLTANGRAFCFGTNAGGEIGDGTALPSTGAVPATPVIGSHVFSQLSVGVFHACGIEAGEVWCWGTNHAFVFGPGTTSAAPYPTPLKIPLTFNAARLELGSATSCVLDAAGKATCWGSNVASQLGRGLASSSTSSPDPTLVVQSFAYESLALPRLNSIIAHACGIVSGGGVICWGLGDANQLGRVPAETCMVSATSSYPCTGVPGTIESTLLFKQLALGRDHTCGVTADDAIYCWGSDARKQLGGTVTTTTKTPVRVTIGPDGAP